MRTYKERRVIATNQQMNNFDRLQEVIQTKSEITVTHRAIVEKVIDEGLRVLNSRYLGAGAEVCE